MVAPVATVDGPVVGTTWSNVQPPLDRPGHRRCDAEVAGEGRQCGLLARLGDEDLQGAGRARPERRRTTWS